MVGGDGGGREENERRVELVEERESGRRTVEGGGEGEREGETPRANQSSGQCR